MQRQPPHAPKSGPPSKELPLLDPGTLPDACKGDAACVLGPGMPAADMRVVQADLAGSAGGPRQTPLSAPCSLLLPYAHPALQPAMGDGSSASCDQKDKALGPGNVDHVKRRLSMLQEDACTLQRLAHIQACLRGRRAKYTSHFNHSKVQGLRV